MEFFLFKKELASYVNLIGLILIVVVLGVVGFWLVEGWGFVDCLYMTIMTLSMVGYGEVHPLSQNGKIFAIVLMVFGIITVVYALGIVVKFVVEGQLTKIMGRSRMEKLLDKLKDHYIICGYGRVGGYVCREFKARKVPFVIIEKDSENIESLSRTDNIYLEGDATDDEILKAAKIDRARGIVSTIASEADNVYLALSARYLNPGLTITCRADSEQAERKIQRAGADRVISPYVIGGYRMALATLRPNVVDFLQVSAAGPKGNFRIEEFYIKENSPLANVKLKDTDIRYKLGLMVVGIRKPEKGMIRNPAADTVIEPGDIIILLGETEQLEKLDEMTTV